MAKKRTWIYCRIADNNPASPELMEAQRLSLEQLAKKHELHVVGSSNDIGSGLTLDRPGLKIFQRAVDSKSVDVLLVMKLSRLGRDMKQLLMYWERLRKSGVQIISCQEGEIDMELNDIVQKFVGG